MPASKQIAVLSVRLPASKLRRIKSLAASRGVTLQEAVDQALEAWALHRRPAVPLPLDALEGSLAGSMSRGSCGRTAKPNLPKRRATYRWRTWSWMRGL